jgi:hypothetical protein
VRERVMVWTIVRITRNTNVAANKDEYNNDASFKKQGNEREKMLTSGFRPLGLDDTSVLRL